MFNIDLLSGHVRPQLPSETARLKSFIGPATTTEDGLMPAADKRKLDNLGLATTTKDGLVPAGFIEKWNEFYDQQRRGFLPVLCNPGSGYSQVMSYDWFAPDYLYVMCQPTDLAGTFDMQAFLDYYGVPNGRDHSFLYFLMDNSQNPYPVNIHFQTAKCICPHSFIVGANEVREVCLRRSTWRTPIGSTLGTLDVLTMSQPLSINFQPNYNTFYE